MEENELKDIIIALIEKGLFYCGNSNEENGKEVAKFVKGYYKEMKDS